MRKTKRCVSWLLIFMLLCSAVHTFAAEESSAVVLAVNEATGFADGKPFELQAPMLVFNKAYVDFYAVAPYLNCYAVWANDGTSRLTVTCGGRSAEFNCITTYEDLKKYDHTYFVKNDEIMLSAREIAALSDVPLAYDGGVLTFGATSTENSALFSAVNPHESDEYVYENYPTVAKYTVNPYQVYSYETMLKDAAELARMYPDLIRLSSIGKSVEDRDLLLMEVGKGENKIFVCGTHHAREYIATTYLMYAVDRYAYAYRTNSVWNGYNVRDILDKVTFCIVPMVNPDGVNLVQNGLYSSPHASEIAKMKLVDGTKYGYTSWKANVHGVDVNWNYDKDWTIKRNKNERGSTGFNGDYPNSEPETVAVSAYVDRVPFDAFLSFHTQGQVIYWSDSKSKPLYIQDAVKKDTGFTLEWDDGTGYGGSFFDYVYRKFDKPMLTFELCPYVGNYPYPNGQFDTVWRPAKNILLVVGQQLINNK